MVHRGGASNYYMKNSLNIVYIFGAGASASIDDSVPVMANFFEKAIDMVDINDMVFPIAFSTAEKARAFPANPEIENTGLKIYVLGELWDKGNRSNSDIEKKLTAAIEDYKRAFRNDAKRTSTNLEDVFAKVESHIEKKSCDARETHGRLQYVIAALFNRLDKQLKDKFTTAPHHHLSEFVASADQFSHTFISFNYDLWLEKSLYEKGLLHPRNGHGSYCFEYYSPPREDVTPIKGTVSVLDVTSANKFTENNQKSKVNVLKPHGSLSLRVGQKDPKNCFVILENDENSCVTYNDTSDFPATSFPACTELTLVPLIVPPSPSKIRSHPLFWETDKDISNALYHADVVVIVGWSMPGTDYYAKNWILNALNNRERQINKLIACDKSNSPELLFSRFETHFRPLQIKTWNNGFSKGFVDF